MTDHEYMERALRLAERGRGRTSPNPMVGAAIVAPDGTVIGAGYHKRAGEPHAEVHALDAAGAAARGATLYCTLEPCCHAGRTGPCVERIAAAGIARVVASVEDPNPKVQGGGFRYLRERGIEVEVGVGRDRAVRLNAPFFTAIRERRPFVIAKIALSQDRRVAAEAGKGTRLTSAAADRRVHLLRAEVDAIGVGAGTVLCDDPLLTVRGVFRPRPLTRVIFDRRLRTPPDARLLSTLDAGPVIILTGADTHDDTSARAAALERGGAIIERVSGGHVGEMMSRLLAYGVQSVLLEGGPRLHRAALRADVIDRVMAFFTPARLGENGVPWLTSDELPISRLQDLRSEPLGPDLLVEGYVHRPH